MTTIKSYTDLYQSKKLAEILPLESADMNWHELPPIGCFARTFPYKKDNGATEGILPCWSLAALLDIIPYGQVNKVVDSNKWEASAWNDTDFEPITVGDFDNPVDACYEMIRKLKENGRI